MNSQSDAILSKGERELLIHGAFYNFRKIGTRTEDKERIAKSRLKKKIGEDLPAQFGPMLQDWNFINDRLSRSNPEMRDEIKSKMAPHALELARFVRNWLPEEAFNTFLKDLITAYPDRGRGQSYIDPKATLETFKDYLQGVSFSGDSFITWSRLKLDDKRKALVGDIQDALDEIGTTRCISLDYFDYHPDGALLQRCLFMPDELTTSYDLVKWSKELVWKYDGEDFDIDDKIIQGYDQIITLRPHYRLNVPLSILASFFKVSTRDEFFHEPSWREENNPVEFMERGTFIDLVERREGVSLSAIVDSIIEQMKARSLVIQKNVETFMAPHKLDFKKGQFDYDMVFGTPFIIQGDWRFIIPSFDAWIKCKGGDDLSSRWRGEIDIIEPDKAIKGVLKQRVKRGRPGLEESTMRADYTGSGFNVILKKSIALMIKENIIENMGKKTYKLTRKGKKLAETDVLRFSPVWARDKVQYCDNLDPHCFSRKTIDATLSCWWQKGNKRENFITIPG